MKKRATVLPNGISDILATVFTVHSYGIFDVSGILGFSGIFSHPLIGLWILFYFMLCTGVSIKTLFVIIVFLFPLHLENFIVIHLLMLRAL